MCVAEKPELLFVMDGFFAGVAFKFRLVSPAIKTKFIWFQAIVLSGSFVVSHPSTAYF
jgi:hypothetical protein